MDKSLVRKIFKNKANNQYSITLPKKIFDKSKIKPKKIRINVEELFE